MAKFSCKVYNYNSCKYKFNGPWEGDLYILVVDVASMLRSG